MGKWILLGGEVNSTHVKGKTAAGEGRPVICKCQNFDSQHALAVSRWMTSVGCPYGYPVYVALLVIKHGLGPDHTGDRVDGEDVVAVRVSICSEKRSQVRTETFSVRRTNKITPERLFLLLQTWTRESTRYRKILWYLCHWLRGESCTWNTRCDRTRDEMLDMDGKRYILDNITVSPAMRCKDLISWLRFFSRRLVRAIMKIRFWS